MAEPLLKLINVHKTLGGQEILRGVNLDILEGETMVIIGRSGTGKSVLLKHIMGLMRPDKGKVIFRGKDLARMGEREIVPLRKDMGMLFQNGALFDSLTVTENVAFSLREARERDEAKIQAEVERALKIVNLPGQGEKMPADLSGGMRKRVALARAAIAKPKLMLYDEPTSGLDPVIGDSINKLITRLGQELEMTNVVVTHDMVSAYDIGDRIAMLYEGVVHRVGTPEEFKTTDDEIIHKFVNGISDMSDAVF